jgi:hypothetical protein
MSAGATTASKVPTGLSAIVPVRGFGAGAEGRIGLHYDDLPAGKLEGLRMDAGEAELEHPPGPVSQQLEDAWRGGSGKGGRKPVHSETLTFGYRGASTRLRSHPSNLIRVMPAKGVR